MSANGGIADLREVRDDDLDRFFLHAQDPVAARMAAFTAKDPADRAAFDAKWRRIRADPQVTVRTVWVDAAVAGHVASFVMQGQLEVTYWIDRAFWGRGVATAALSALLATVDDRPVHARAAKDNLASIRVLEKCGFRRIAEDRGFANARGEEIDEVVLVLDASAPA